jgi:YVTN family beta-propeller protein
VWAGTWAGNDPQVGSVTGNWEAELSQVDTGVSGTVILSGDVDCTDGALTGSADTVNESIAGTLSRLPCQQNEWVLTALNLEERSASGAWTQPGAGAAGTFTGLQIARPGGPRISFFSPPGGRPGTLVTVVGSSFATIAADNDLLFGAAAAEVLTAKTATLVARAPLGATSGPLALNTPAETAFSAHAFNANVAAPGAFVSNSLVMGVAQEGVAFSPDGRRAYVANREAGTVGMLDVASGVILATTAIDPATPVSVQGVVVSPDGRRIYVASGSRGITMLHAGTGAVVDTLPVSAGGGAEANPQGLAISLDGRFLYVANDRDGGAFTVFNLPTRQVAATISRASGYVPGGVAMHPDGAKAYLAFAKGGEPGEVVIFDAENRAELGSISLGAGPVGLAVTPDGETLYVANRLGNSVSAVNTSTNQIISTIAVHTEPTGLAISPDGGRVYVACRGSNLVDVIETATDHLLATVPVSFGPVGVAVSPDGHRAYVTHAEGGFLQELGGPLTLTVAKVGTGIGTVTSAPDGLACGANCRASFDLGTVVTLTAIPDAVSTFTGWEGDPDCADGTVVMNAGKTCTAVFTAIAGLGGGDGGFVSPGCFIATAAYGSYLHPHVQVLRDFRDKHLLTHRSGRKLVNFYYRYSPPIADVLRRHALLRGLVRAMLTPFVYGLKYPISALLLLGTLPLSLCGWQRWKRGRRVASLSR